MVNPRTVARMEARIKQRAAHCLQFEMNDPRAGMVTITKVELTPDLSRAKVFYSCLGSAADRRRTVAMLDSAAGYVQRQVARVLETRTVPHLVFVFDESVERAADMDRLIEEALRRDGEVRGPDEGDQDPD